MITGHVTLRCCVPLRCKWPGGGTIEMNLKNKVPGLSCIFQGRNPGVTLLVLLLAAALFLRLVFFTVSVTRVPPTGDESLLMLQAKHIRTEGEKPLLFWAQPYTFPLESYVNAPLTGLLPNNGFGARLLLFAWGLLALGSVFAVIRWGGRQEDLGLVWLLVLFPSAYWVMMQSAYAPPSYPSSVGLGLLAIFLANLARTRARFFSMAMLAAASGLAAGLACSVNLMVTPILLAVGLYLVMSGSLFKFLVTAPFFAVSALMGLTPYLLARRIPGAYRNIAATRPFAEALGEIWNQGLPHTLPGALGIQFNLFPDLTGPYSLFPVMVKLFPWLWLCLVTGALISGIISFFRKSWQNRWPTMDLADIFTIVALLGLLLFGLSRRSGDKEYRYLLLLAVALPFHLIWLYRCKRKPIRMLATGLILGLAMINIIHTVVLIRKWQQPGFAFQTAQLPDIRPVISFLEDRKIHFAYGSWFSAYRITYLTDEKILCGQYYNERFFGWPLPYKERVNQQKRVAFVLDPTRHLSPALFEKELKSHRVQYRKKQCGFYTVFSDFHYHPVVADIQIPEDQLEPVVSCYPRLRHALTDGDPVFRWRSHQEQQKGMYVEIRLPKKRLLTKVRLYYNRFKYSQARRLTIMVWQQNGFYPIRKDISQYTDLFRIQQGHPVITSDIVQTIRLDPVETDRLRIVITEPAPGKDWSIGEVQLFAATCMDGN